MQTAKSDRAHTLEFLSRLEGLGALPEFDSKWLEKLKAAVENDSQ